MPRPPPPLLPALLIDAPAPLRAEFAAAARIAPLEKGRVLLRPGSACPVILFPVAGGIRVFQTGAEGREVTLYQIDAAESCVLSASCAIGEQSFPATAVVSASGRAWAVPAVEFRAWIERHPFWRRYVFALIARRLGEVLAKLEDVAFRRVDARLAACLLGRDDDGLVSGTQQQLADELGSAREVVSRTLAAWRAKGLVEPGRGRVRILRPDRLREIARS